MARVKRAVNAQKKRRTTLELASGYRGQRSRLYRKAKEQMLHSLNYAYRDRRAKKGDFRQLWITRINAAARANGMTYNRFIQGLKAAGVEVDRKILAELAVSEPAAFAALVEVAKANVPAQAPPAGPRPEHSGSPAPANRPAPSAPRASSQPASCCAARAAIGPGGSSSRAPRPSARRSPPLRGRPCTSCSSPTTAAERHPELVDAARDAGVRIVPVTDARCRRASPTPSPRRASSRSATCSTCRSSGRARRTARRSSRCCAGVADPGNAGTVIRVADAAGAGAVLLAGDTVDPHNGKAVRASTGSVFHLPLARDRDAAAVLDACRAAGLTLLAADGRGELDLHDPRRRRRAGRPDGLGVRRRGARPPAGPRRGAPTTGCASRSTAGRRASTWPRRRRCASTRAPAALARRRSVEPCSAATVLRSTGVRVAASAPSRKVVRSPCPRAPTPRRPTP